MIRKPRSIHLALASLLSLHMTFSTTPQAKAQFPELSVDANPGWIFMVDFLSWSVHNPPTEYAISDIGGVQDRGAVGTVLDLDTNYDPGIRISAGRRLFGSAVEGRFTYTYFDSFTNERFDGPVRSTFISSDNSENDDSDNINTSGVETIFADDRATRAVASLDFDYNTFDWEVAQAVNLTQSLAMRLSGKFRYLNMNQDFRVTYTGGDFQTAFTPFETNAYDGGGIILGSEIRWYTMRR